MLFSNLVLKDVTGPIHISVGSSAKPNPSAPDAPPEPEPADPSNPAIARNISFSNIHGTVTTSPPQLREASVSSGYRAGERRSAITLSAVGGSIIENICFDNIHLTFGGGGTAEDAARRELPQIAGEYFMLGPIPAFGFYARNSHALTLQNVRLQFSEPDLRPALILDHVEDAAIDALSVQADAAAESALRFINCKDVLLTAPRLLTPALTFLQLEGRGNERIKIDGGDISRATAPLTFVEGATDKSVWRRE